MSGMNAYSEDPAGKIRRWKHVRLAGLEVIDKGSIKAQFQTHMQLD